ncbi:hypothetical protein BH24ACT13_BH24ACT13_07760 [soil metagenome]
MSDHDPSPSAARRKPKSVELVRLNAAALRALADGDLDAANRAAPVTLSPYFVADESRSTWLMRSQQVQATPVSADWVTGVIWDVERQVAVGRAGYHGPPDAAGMVEVGYAVDPVHRGQGYARAALESLLDRAVREPDVRMVRASIRPDNVASHRLVSQYGFVEVGEQWDDEDGLEKVYEVSAERATGGDATDTETTYPTVAQVVLDCPDARALAEFYRELLGLHYRSGDEPPPPGEPDPAGSDWLVLRNATGAQLAFQQVAGQPESTWPDGTHPQMLHLDLTVPTTTALDAQHPRALALGARLLLDRSADPEEPLRVYADLAGHPFCIFVAAPTPSG